MGWLTRKKMQSRLPLLQAEAAAARTASSPESPDSTVPQSSHDSAHEQEPTSEQHPSTSSEQLNPTALSPVGHEQGVVENTDPEDMLDPALIGRTIKLARAENWDQDIIPTIPQQTKVLYENQRGMFFFGKPYFSCNALVRSLEFDPPPYQNTNAFLTSHPGPIDPSDSENKNWPPDPLKLYYSPYSPRDGFLSMDSAAGQGWIWKQDRWYVDMRGDVDEEGWQYAFYWNGRYRWCGGNWHGKAVFIHGWVRRRKWIRELHRKQKPEVVTEEEQSGNRGSGGFDGLLSALREAKTPDKRRVVLRDFFDALPPETMKSLSDYIHHIYILIGPINTKYLIQILERHQPNYDEEVKSAIATSLSYLLTKRDSLPFKKGILPTLKSLSTSNWTPVQTTTDFPNRRLRLRILRKQWRESHTLPSTHVRKVRFTATPSTGEFVTAPESFSRGSLSRSESSESGDEWFIAPEEQGGPVERGLSVAGLLREGRMREQAIVDEPAEM